MAQRRSINSKYFNGISEAIYSMASIMLSKYMKALFHFTY